MSPEDPLRIAITCYPTVGGSGIIATEIGLALARRGHEVHFVCSAMPTRLSLGPAPRGITFHPVTVCESPLPHLGAYPLALAGRLAEVSVAAQIDLLHLHYAVPHAVSAHLCRQLLLERGLRVPKVVTTLHGTDVTQLGSEPSLQAISSFALRRCDGLTVPSEFLRAEAHARLLLPSQTPIEVIPNFVDTERFCPAPAATPLNAALPPELLTDTPLLVHSSNFRAIKRIDEVVRIFARVQAAQPARPVRLVLIGDGPERPQVEQLVRELGLSAQVVFVGLVLDVVPLLQRSAVFLLASANESFGLAALEALSCGVPVVAPRVGGLAEVITDGETGFLCAAGDLEGMAAATLRLLRDEPLRRRMAQTGRAQVLARWQTEQQVARYEEYYRRILRG